ncbi:MAG: hydrogenase formation protein HypD [endosymbiont of Galathealinum brachiosum]|uniref:Hydrogenase maturation factor n=1 Tax=endosymbiont of Galathealinum brachiosum TaxID=2200906 RepID=A0A370DHB5_9GAMM|nr:MAG: hydrogenase formation protein HypD [endosymbiont of Galathealinum brachiosum]
MEITAKQWLEKIHNLPHQGRVKIMNVCGGHERSITMAGLRQALPEYIELVPGPGCPVCICPEEDVFEAIQLALHEDIILVAFGDMLRVPVNVKKIQIRTLEQAKAQGADIRPIASPIEAVIIAKENPQKPVVFFAAGFETTTAPVAAMLVQGIPDNLSVLLSGRLTWPAVSMLLESGAPGFDALIAPGHVATIMGPEEWGFVVAKHHIPAAVSGFEPVSLLAAMYSVLRQLNEKRYFLDNCYSSLVKPGGNASAQKHLNTALSIYDANWRGVGVIPDSGFKLNLQYEKYDTRKQFPDYADDARKRAGKMPAGCDCAQVVLGKIYPSECKLFGKTCLPRSPIGPCMVSDEGACRIWWSGGLRDVS